MLEGALNLYRPYASLERGRTVVGVVLAPEHTVGG